MKKIKIIIALVMGVNASVWAQNNSNNTGVHLSNFIADKMRDTLSLDSAKRGQVFAVNIQLHNQKLAARTQIQNSDSLRLSLQGIENTRDSLYHNVLTTEQYQLYQQKKATLIRRN